MLDLWHQVLLVSLQNVGWGVVTFSLLLAEALLVFIIGYVVAYLLGMLVTHVIRAIQLDALLRKLNAEPIINRSGHKLDSGKFIGKVVEWIIIVAALISALNILHLTLVTAFLTSVLNYLPQVIVAVLILSAGFLIGSAMEKVVTAAAKSTNLHKAALLGTIARWAIWVFAVLVALYHLGIAAVFSEAVFTGVITTISLALGLAFGLGGQTAAAEIIAETRRNIADKR